MSGPPPDELTDERLSCTHALPILVDGAARLGFTIDGALQTQFVEYCVLLSRANRRMNLTALRAPEQIMRGLFLDSLTIPWAIRDRENPGSETLRLVDVGSGAGIPGIPIKLIQPSRNLVLVESIGKKAEFQRDVSRGLGLCETQVVPARAETAGRDLELRDSAMLCTARAVTSLPTLIEWCAPLTAAGGLLCFPKSSGIDEEIVAAEAAARALKARLEAVVTVPPDVGVGENRVIVLYRKLGATPDAYPRREGLAKSQPIGRAVRASPHGRQSR